MKKILLFLCIFLILSSGVCGAETFKYENFSINISTPQNFIDAKDFDPNLYLEIGSFLDDTMVYIGGYIPIECISSIDKENDTNSPTNYVALACVKKNSFRQIQYDEYKKNINRFDDFLCSDFMKYYDFGISELDKIVDDIIFQTPVCIEKKHQDKYSSYFYISSFSSNKLAISFYQISSISFLYVNKNLLVMYTHLKIDNNIREAMLKTEKTVKTFAHMVYSMNN